jgi:hypothetical protein
MSGAGDTVQTVYGSLNRGVLDVLQERHRAADVLGMVEEWDRHIQTFNDEDGLRGRLLALHGMLHTVMDGAQVTTSSDQTIPDLASDVADEVRDLVEMLGRWTAMLSLICDLGAAEPLDREP